MISWAPYVFVRVVIFFMGGIVLGIYYPDSIHESLAHWILLILLVLYSGLFVSEKVFYKRIINPGVVALLAIFLSGYICLLNNTDSRSKNHLLQSSGEIKYYEAIVTQHAQEKESTWKFEAEVVRIKDEIWRPAEGKILIYLSKADFTTPFKYGDVLLIEGAPQLVKPPANPGEFDYKRYLSFKKIYHQHFLRKGEVKVIRNAPPYAFMDLAIQMRIWADATLKKFISGSREQATASALVLGVTDGLDDELLTAYASTGAMHVLAVSGLHISIIYLIISLVLRPLNKVKNGKWIIAIVSIFCLWAYSFVTGLSPSVLRAVVMFSFVALAKPWKRQTNIYNTLAAAAFCILLYEPYLIMSVGFQLSFLAVLGIVYLQPLVYAWWEAPTWIMNEVWKITSVSIAAQVATFPLGLLYFHQFPNYFLFSNLFVIPGSFVVLIAGLALLTLSFIPVAAASLGVLLEWTIQFLNWIVFTVEAFPFSLVENIYITPFQCWVLMIIVSLLVLLFVKRKLVFLKAAILFSVLFSFTQWSDFIHRMDSRHFTVYKVSGHSAIDLIDRGQATFCTDSALSGNTEKIRFHVQPNRLLRRVHHVNEEIVSSSYRGCQLMVWNGKRILRAVDKKVSWPQQIPIDFLIVSNNSVPDFSRLPENLHTIPIILDSSNSFYFAEKAMQNATKLRLNMYSVLHHGAYDVDLKTDDHEVHNL